MGIQKLNILVVDDEEQIVEIIRAYLDREGYHTISAYNGQEALNIFEREEIHFVVLDLMLPDVTGEEVCKKIRVKSQVPILMLTAKVEEVDRIYGLNIGADDYMMKPFSPKELVARIKAIIRRFGTELVKAEIIEFHDGDLLIDFDKMEIKKQGELVNITPKEFEIVALLAKHPGKVFTRENLILEVLGYDFEGYERAIDAHIKNIRHKIEDEKVKYIKTIYGVGYKFMEG
ncbi:DNA-binding response OmpR family regulator [Anaerosolibacter carboniphilus]|uniref:Stage 0 sporulation protein A homolog n=1 Tax=Anaerosolibacter carboniphilus TaxID=1417629 RepID=A0A841KZ82_9FIRM|nr:response regulator transcription factor [Anaerosolibacter carboniphilus]MBB6215435.1 DNA-binding response OmpR family regulator [Anaerosolibacter carboniphilus]